MEWSFICLFRFVLGDCLEWSFVLFLFWVIVLEYSVVCFDMGDCFGVFVCLFGVLVCLFWVVVWSVRLFVLEWSFVKRCAWRDCVSVCFLLV